MSSVAVRPVFTAGFAGSSWVKGRYVDWVERLETELPRQPEAVGPIRIYNRGQGGATSSAILANQIPALCVLRPNHVFLDPGHVNSSADTGGGPAVSRAQTIADIQAMVGQLRAAIPGVDITLCTMFSISATSLTIHPAYLDYAADVRAAAVLLDCGLLDTLAGMAMPLDGEDTWSGGSFALPVTAGYDPLPDGAAWNPAGKDSRFFIDADGIGFMTSGAVGFGAMRGADAITGQRHCELAIQAASAFYPGFGIATAAASLAGFVGSDAHGIAVYGNDTVYRNGGIVGAAGFTFGAGDTIGWEVDRPNNLIYFMKGAIRSAGFDISGLAGAIYPAVSLNASGLKARARFTPSGDGLHADNATVAAFHYPGALALFRNKMAAFWDL